MIPLVELLFAYQPNLVARRQEIPPRVPTTCKAGSLGLRKFTGKTGGTVQYRRSDLTGLSDKPSRDLNPC